MEILIEHIAWSNLYWTNDETSDMDYRWVFIEDINNIYTNNRTSTYFDKEQEDYELKELWFFLQLATENNPNILETLFCPPEFITKKHPLWDIIYNKRYEFLSQKAITTFYWYINSQMQRMIKTNNWMKNIYSLDNSILEELWLKNQVELMDLSEDIIEDIIYRKWLNRKNFSMIVKPKHNEHFKVLYNFTSNKNYNKVSNELLEILESSAIWTKIETWVYFIYLKDINNKYSFTNNWMISALNNGDLSQMWIDIRELSPDIIISFNTQEFDNHMKNYNGYYSWKSTKNSNRLELQKQNWYDSKFLMHIFRLYAELKDILILNDIRVDRRWIDNQFLYDIKKWKYNFDEVQDMIKEIDIEINKLIDQYKNTLPLEPTIDIKKLEIDIYNKYFN